MEKFKGNGGERILLGEEKEIKGKEIKEEAVSGVQELDERIQRRKM